VDAELEGERARRESAEAHEKTLRAQISKEAKIQQDWSCRDTGDRHRRSHECNDYAGHIISFEVLD
jgi:hypothetical protein